ncbi:MAG: VWA domain-containing protein [Candidatus Pacebacteria bacterium]|nr:VWA domain-containing protein [Candidatus Paceibacterota bacterium]
MKKFVLSLLLMSFLSTGVSAQDTSEEKNILLAFDASGSMGEMFGGVSRMDALKQAADTFLDNLDSSQLVGLRTFAQIKNDNKESSCKITTLNQSFSTNRNAIKTPISLLNPVGSYTPLAYTLEQAKGDFKEGKDNVLILMTDGKDTCGGDAAKTASELFNSTKKIKVHVIGINIDSASKVELESIAKNGGGSYYDAQNSESLLKSFQEIQKNEKPVERTFEVSALGGTPVDGGNDFKSAYHIYASTIIKDGVVGNIFSSSLGRLRLKNHLAPNQYAYFKISVCVTDNAKSKFTALPKLAVYFNILGDDTGVAYNSVDNSFEKTNLHNYRVEFFDDLGLPFGKPVELKDVSMIKNKPYEIEIPSLIGYNEARESGGSIDSCNYYMRIGSSDFAISKYDLFSINTIKGTSTSNINLDDNKDISTTSANQKKESGNDNKLIYIISGLSIFFLLIIISLVLFIIKSKKSVS